MAGSLEVIAKLEAKIEDKIDLIDELTLELNDVKSDRYKLTEQLKQATMAINHMRKDNRL
jgi:FtsZ-binding cell division protein ZapB